jgi:hypothetical protein
MLHNHHRHYAALQPCSPARRNNKPIEMCKDAGKSYPSRIKYYQFSMNIYEKTRFLPDV